MKTCHKRRLRRRRRRRRRQGVRRQSSKAAPGWSSRIDLGTSKPHDSSRFVVRLRHNPEESVQKCPESWVRHEPVICPRWKMIRLMDWKRFAHQLAAPETTHMAFAAISCLISLTRSSHFLTLSNFVESNIFTFLHQDCLQLLKDSQGSDFRIPSPLHISVSHFSRSPNFDVIT